jgi:hypothetical protein
VTLREPGKCKFCCPFPRNVRHLPLKRACRKVCTLRQRHTQTILQKVISPAPEAWTPYRVSGLMAINLTKGINLSLAFPYKFSMKWSRRVKKHGFWENSETISNKYEGKLFHTSRYSTRWHTRIIGPFLRCLSMEIEIGWGKQGSLISFITF